MKKPSILSRVERVAQNLKRDPLNGRYYGVKKVNGRQILNALDTADRKLADRRLGDWLASIAAGEQSGPDITFESLVKKTLAAIRKNTRTDNNQDSLANHLLDTFRPNRFVSIRKVRTSDLLSWLNLPAHKDWSGSYYNASRQLLRKMFKLAQADRIVTRDLNPFDDDLIPSRARGKTFRRIPTLAQFVAIIGNVRNNVSKFWNNVKQADHSADFLAFLGLAGLGQAEAAALKWRDDRGGELRIIRVKTGKYFTVPVYDWLAPLMDKLRTERGDAGPDENVFKINDARKALTQACKRLGFPHYTERNLRALCIKRLYDAGVDIKQIAAWQGHSDGGVLILKTYTEVFTDLDSVAAQANLKLVAKAAKSDGKRSGNIIDFHLPDEVKTSPKVAPRKRSASAAR